jgi:hypothetical protein
MATEMLHNKINAQRNYCTIRMVSCFSFVRSRFAFPARTQGPALQKNAPFGLLGPENHGLLRGGVGAPPHAAARGVAVDHPHDVGQISGRRLEFQQPAGARELRVMNLSAELIRSATKLGPAGIELPACLHQKRHHCVYA